MIPEIQPAMNAIVLGILQRRSWVKPSELQSMIFADYGRWISDAAATARCRDLRKSKYGGWTIECRPCKQSQSYEYRLIQESK